MCVAKAQTKRSRAGQYASSYAALRHFSPESGWLDGFADWANGV